MRKSRKQLLSSVLALAVAAATVFGIAPSTTKAQTTQVTVESQQVAAEEQIILHAKGSDMAIHIWGCSDTSANTTWPGKSMEADSTMGSGWCYVAFPADCKGFIILQGGNKLTEDVTDKKAGEYWFSDGKFSTSNPEGPTPVPTEAPTPTPAPIVISEITPGDGSQLKAGEPQQISVSANTSIDDGTLYYKYEVKCDGAYVGDHYYSKSNTYSFTPEDGKEYKVKISVQAHDEDNTTVTEELTYTGSKDGVTVTTAPATEAPTPTPSDDNGEATPEPISTPSVSDNPGNLDNKTTPTPSNDSNGEATATPTTKPTATPKVTATPTATAKVTATPTPSVDVPEVSDEDISVKLSKSKSSPQKAGTSIKLTATASGGDGGYQYKFYYKKSGSSSNVTIQKYSTKNTCTWKPVANGTYTLYVTVKDSSNFTATAKIANYKIKGMTLSVSTNKKSPQKAKTAIKISAKASNASGKVKYQYIIKRGSKVEKRTKFTSSKSYTWKPKKKGTYTLYVKAKDSNITIMKKKTFKIK